MKNATVSRPSFTELTCFYVHMDLSRLTDNPEVVLREQVSQFDYREGGRDSKERRMMPKPTR